VQLEVLELEPSDAEQKSSVLGFFIQYIFAEAAVAPKTFVFGPSGDAPIVGVR